MPLARWVTLDKLLSISKLLVLREGPVAQHHWLSGGLSPQTECLARARRTASAQYKLIIIFPVLGVSLCHVGQDLTLPRPVPTWLFLLVPKLAGHPSLSHDWSPQLLCPSLGLILSYTPSLLHPHNIYSFYCHFRMTPENFLSALIHSKPKKAKSIPVASWLSPPLLPG